MAARKKDPVMEKLQVIECWIDDILETLQKILQRLSATLENDDEEIEEEDEQPQPQHRYVIQRGHAYFCEYNDKEEYPLWTFNLSQACRFDTNADTLEACNEMLLDEDDVIIVQVKE